MTALHATDLHQRAKELYQLGRSLPLRNFSRAIAQKPTASMERLGRSGQTWLGTAATPDAERDFGRVCGSTA